MHAYCNQLVTDDGAVLAEFSGHSAAVAALCAPGKPIDETRWPYRPQDLAPADLAQIKALRAAGLI